MTTLPRVVIAGYPHGGKSTLFNRLTGTREAVVAPESGVTRDRKEGVAEWGGREFLVVDTGGMDTRSTELMADLVRAQAAAAIDEADVVVFLVDGRIGVGPDEVAIAKTLRRTSTPVVLAVNKIDAHSAAERIHEFWELGLGEPLAISAEHGLGLGDLLDLVVAALPEASEQAAPTQEPINVAIVGRPNVGKSSLLNALLGSERVIVSPIPGTTRDAIDTSLLFRDRPINLVDTAGLRRPSRRTGESLEYYSSVRTMNALRRSDVALVMVDASEGLVDLDLQVAYEVQRAGCATAMLFNKWDVADMDLEKAIERVATKVQMRPPCLTISCLTGKNLARVLPLVMDLYERYSMRIPTPALNQWLRALRSRTAFPQRSGKSLKVFYVVQYDACPPRFKAMVNSRALITRSFAYYFENRLRQEFGLAGIPVIVDFQGKEERYSWRIRG